MTVHPLAITNVDWETLIEICQSELGHSPTRGIDDENLNLKDPSSYLACMPLDNKPIQALRYGGSHLRHCHMSFVAVVTVDEMQQISELWQYADMYSRPMKHPGKRIVTFTSSIHGWREGILAFCKDKTEPVLRKLMNDILQIFESSNFKYCFMDYRKVSQLDKTFILIPR